MNNSILRAENANKKIDTHHSEHQGEEWIKAILEQDFKHLAILCQPDIKSTLLLPRRIGQLDTANDLAVQVEDWFGDYDFIQQEQSRVAMVGEKMGIFYRLRCVKNDGAEIIEQQLYCTLRDGRFELLRLICSGFQPDLASIPAPLAAAPDATSANMQAAQPSALQADALLEFKAAAGQGSTCALLTPFIKSKLGGMSSGQVLEVHVDDLTAREDIEAWSRLSGNKLLRMDQIADKELKFFIQKK